MTYLQNIIDAARAVLDNADNTGCDGDLTVTCQIAVEALEAALAQPEPDIYALFAQVREHPDFIGGTYFSRADIPAGTVLPADWRQKRLTDPLAECVNAILDDNRIIDPTLLAVDEECPGCRSGTLEADGDGNLVCRGECGNTFIVSPEGTN
jgi:hypothetical protein